VSSPTPKRENLLLNLLFNIALPAIVLTKLSGPARLGPVIGLVVALAFPLGYGAWDFLQRRQTNFISVLGFISVLLTGGLGLLHIGGLGFAIKEAAVPTVIAVAVLVSLKSKRPLVRSLLYNEQVIDVAKVDAALDARGTHAGFERLLVTSSYLLALSFLLSAVLNFSLARYLLKSPAGTPEFNAELGKMHWLALLVIAVPSMVAMMLVFWKLMNSLAELSGLAQDEIFREQKK
jgi:hypothetical protein